MGFLGKITNIKTEKKSSFRETVEKEKREKYLFSEPKTQKTRNTGLGVFQKKEGKRSTGFSRFLGGKLEATRDFAKEQEFYMRWIGLFLIGASLYILFYSPYFLLSPSKVMIEALDPTVDVSIAYRSIEDIYGKNIFLLDEVSLAKSIQSYQKNISHIRIDHLYPNNLKILLSGQPISFEVSLKSRTGEKWGMTDNGIFVPSEKINTSTGISLLTVIDNNQTEDSFLDYRELLSPETTSTIRKMLSTFENMWPMFPLANTLYLKKEDELHIILKNNVRIIFTLQDFTKKTGESSDSKYLSLQYINLKTFIDGHMEDMKNGAYTYIDARVPERIFSCRERIQCSTNLKTIYPDIE